LPGAAELLKENANHALTANAPKGQKGSNFIEFYENRALSGQTVPVFWNGHAGYLKGFMTHL
jgi:hypothetical protein